MLLLSTCGTLEDKDMEIAINHAPFFEIGGVGYFNLGSLALNNNSHFIPSTSYRPSKRQWVACHPPVRREIGQRSSEHLVLIGLCLWMVFILVCHIMSFFPPPFLLPLSFFSLQ